MARARRELRHNAETWPGFVDALSTLLLVIIFLLVVFVLAQFFLNQLLQGKDTQLQSLEQAISQLTEQLNLEQATSSELRLSVSQLSSDLQSALADRDDTAALLAEVETERDQFRDQVFLLEDEQALLNQTLSALRENVAQNEGLQAELERSVDLRERLQAELEQARQTVTTDQRTIETQLAQLIQLRRDIEALEEVRGELELQVAEMTSLLQAAETVKGEATEEIARLASLLEAAQTATADLQTRVDEMSRTVTAADQETGSLEAEITRLTQLLEATRAEEAASDQQVARLSAELSSARDERSTLQSELARLEALLSSTRADNEAREARIAELSQQLEAVGEQAGERERRVAELAALLEAARENRSASQTDLAELQAARERLLQELGQVRDRTAELEAGLAGEQERTMLAQRELEQRDLRLEELLRSAGRSEEALATEQALSREALNQVNILNRQINALRVQLASLEQALDLEQQKVEEQEVTIADLGSKLNLALAGKVEELSRFRSEFFGRLRQLLGERPDVRVVGDRFVFQSEVLFPTASADIEPGGRDELRKLADSLREISSEIPSDLPWVLQINGHTDRRPISTPEFPSNWELSAARAINVGKFLVEEGIPPERIAVAGFADFQPLDDRRDEIAYRRNRRIEIKLTTP
jgi:chemotaxis protein MotB